MNNKNLNTRQQEYILNFKNKISTIINNYDIKDLTLLEKGREKEKEEMIYEKHCDYATECHKYFDLLVDLINKENNPDPAPLGAKSGIINPSNNKKIVVVDEKDQKLKNNQRLQRSNLGKIIPKVTKEKTPIVEKKQEKEQPGNQEGLDEIQDLLWLSENMANNEDEYEEIDLK